MTDPTPRIIILTVSDVMRLKGLHSRSTVTRAINAKPPQLRAVKIGRGWAIRDSDAMEWTPRGQGAGLRDWANRQREERGLKRRDDSVEDGS